MAKNGWPVYIERIGEIKVKEFCDTFPDEGPLMHIHAQSYEILQKKIYMACSHAMGKQIQNTVSIIDLNNFAITSMNKKLYGLVNSGTSIMENNYPENLGRSFITNAPMLFTGVWAIIKNFLDE